MSFRLTVFRLCLVGVSLLAFSFASLRAQAPGSPIVFAPSAITTSFVTAPTVGSNQGSLASDNQWLKVEFHYGVNPPSPLKFVDAVEFRVWIEGRDLYAPEAPTKDGIAVGLTGTVTYVAIPATRDCYGVFYVPPATLDRYASARGKQDFDRFDIHIEAYINGTKVDYFDKNKEQDANWYQQLKPLTGYVYRQDQCAFIVSDPDRYPPIKVPPTMVAQ